MQWTPSASNLTCTCDRIRQHWLWWRKWLWIGSASVEDLLSYLEPVTGFGRFGQCWSTGRFSFFKQPLVYTNEQIWSDKFVCRHMLSNSQLGSWPSNQPVDQLINRLTHYQPVDKLSTGWPNYQPVAQMINQLTKLSISCPNDQSVDQIPESCRVWNKATSLLAVW